MPNVFEITDLSDPRLDVYARLTEAELRCKYDASRALFIAESPKVIERALDFGCEPVSMLLERKHIEGQAAGIIARCGDIPVFTAPFDVLTELTGFRLTRGVLCAMKRPALPDPAELLKNARRAAVLEEVENPTNVGAIFRSAAALGMDCVLLSPSCADPLYRRACRVSMGTVFQIPWTYFPGTAAGWPESGMALLKAQGFRTAALALRDDSVGIGDPELMREKKLALLLGTEGDGLKEQTIAASDYTVRIPMAHGVDSLNVAAASAVAFWQLAKR